MVPRSPSVGDPSRLIHAQMPTPSASTDTTATAMMEGIQHRDRFAPGAQVGPGRFVIRAPGQKDPHGFACAECAQNPARAADGSQVDRRQIPERMRDTAAAPGQSFVEMRTVLFDLLAGMPSEEQLTLMITPCHPRSSSSNGCCSDCLIPGGRLREFARHRTARAPDPVLRYTEV